MTSQALRDKFLAKLKDLGGRAGNGRLLAELGWQDGTYDNVRAELLEEGLIVLRRGRE